MGTQTASIGALALIFFVKLGCCYAFDGEFGIELSGDEVRIHHVERKHLQRDLRVDLFIKGTDDIQITCSVLNESGNGHFIRVRKSKYSRTGHTIKIDYFNIFKFEHQSKCSIEFCTFTKCRYQTIFRLFRAIREVKDIFTKYLHPRITRVYKKTCLDNV